MRHSASRIPGEANKRTKVWMHVTGAPVRRSVVTGRLGWAGKADRGGADITLHDGIRNMACCSATGLHALARSLLRGPTQRDLTSQLHEDENAARLLSIPGIGTITVSLLASEVGNVAQFAGGRNFAASIGLVPRQHSTGGRSVLCGISKRGDRHLRHLLVQGARALMQRVNQRTDRLGAWIRSMLMRRHPNVVACAVANVST
ncbi:hypothetical protein CA603_30830 [Paraburkholderia hospita]|nr:hypothetical protein CA603_30830 [Paraburkholderia hospita]